jgi:hypothetical protein
LTGREGKEGLRASGEGQTGNGGVVGQGTEGALRVIQSVNVDGQTVVLTSLELGVELVGEGDGRGSEDRGRVLEAMVRGLHVKCSTRRKGRKRQSWSLSYVGEGKKETREAIGLVRREGRPKQREVVESVRDSLQGLTFRRSFQSSLGS